MVNSSNPSSYPSPSPSQNFNSNPNSNTAVQGASNLTTLCNPLNANSIQDVILLLVNIATYIGVILAVLALIYVGFKFIAAQGNPAKLESARKFLLGVVIGIAILLGAQAIVLIIKNTLTSAGVVQSTAFTNSGTTASSNSTNSTCAGH